MKRLSIVGAGLVASLVLLCALLAPAASAAVFTAGLTSITGTSDDWGNSSGMSATQVTTGTTGGNLTGISWYVGQVSVAPNNLGQVAVYADAANLPGGKLAASGSQALTANAWNTFPLTGVTVAASTKYWLVFNVNGSTTRYKITTGGRAAWKIPTAFGTWPASFGTPTPAANSERYAINMTWTDVVAPPTTTTPPPPPSGQACPPLPAHPTPACTGAPDGTALTDLAGNQTITQDGAVLDGRHVLGSVIVKARNVVIRNSVIDGGIDDDFDNTDYSLTVTDTTIGPATGCIGYPGIVGQNFTATRVEVRGHDDGFHLGQPGDYAVVRDSFERSCGLPPSQAPPDGSHADGFQAYCPQVACGMVTIEHSTLEEGSPYYTAPVFAGIGASNGHPTGLSLTGSLLIGGVYTVYVGWQGGPDYTIADNTVAAPSPGFRSWDYGPVSTDGTCAHQAWSGNQIAALNPDYSIASVVGPLTCGG